MPDKPQEMDLEQRRRQLEERRRMLEQRRQEISRGRSETEAAAPSPPEKPQPEQPAGARTPPPAPPVPPRQPPAPPEGKPTPPAPPVPPRQPPAPPERKPTPPAPPVPPRQPPAPPKAAPPPPVEKPRPAPPEKPAPKPSVPEAPAPKTEKVAPPSKPEVAKAAVQPQRSRVPLVIGGVVALIVVIVVAVLMLSGKKAQQESQIEQAREDSLRIAQLAQARADSARRVVEQQAAAAIAELREKVSEAERLQATRHAKGDYDQASSLLDEAVRLAAQGNHDLAAQRARSGTERIDSALDRSRRAQEREDLARRDRDAALTRLQGEVAALQESLSVLKAAGGAAFAGAQVQQLEQIVQKARQFAEAGNLTGGQEQVSYALDMASKVRFAIIDGQRQKAEAEQRLAERQAKAREDSIAKARADSMAQALPPTKAVATKTVVPVYPRPAMLAGISGTVEVEFEVGVDGRARDFKIVKALGAGCDESAIDALKQWEFKPATQGGKPVATRMKIPMVFKKP